MNALDRLPVVAQRVRRFFSAPQPRMLVAVNFPADRGNPVTVLPLDTFNFDRDLAAYLDLRLASLRPTFLSKTDIDDDWLPVVFPFFGIAEHTAWLGLDVHMQPSTSTPIPIVHTLADISRLTCSDQTPWYRRMQQSYDHLRSRKDGTFLLGHRGTMSPMDMANAVRGNDLYTDFYDAPDFVHALLAHLENAIAWYYPRLTSWADSHDGSPIFGFTSTPLLPNTLGHLSNDAAMLCSAAVYEEFGFPYEQRLIARFGGALFHVHNQKMHYISKLASLPGLSLLEVSHDPKTTPPADDVDRILPLVGNVPLMLAPTSDELRRNLPRLARHRCFLHVQCASRADALDILSLTRDYRA